MSKITLIVAMDEQRGIGKGQKLLCHLPEDLAFFKAQTMGKPMIMGRRTYESIGKALPGRRSIVLSSKSLSIMDADVVYSIQDAVALCKQDPEIMIIGGSTLYQQFLPIADRILMTYIHHTFDADIRFPKYHPSSWNVTVLKEFTADQKNIYDLTFLRYDKR